MHTAQATSSDLHFLSGGGEMGELIRATDWTQSPLGHPATWPPSLKTMVAVMLDNPFGMYIAWGDDYIQLYNDGYRPILGSTKHPQALGISTKETFKEIWHIIGSMFGGVMEGKAVRYTDLMLPLNRNGFVEECYFDFSYSPIRKEDGTVGGVLVTVIETTNKKKAEHALKQSETHILNVVNSLPLVVWSAGTDGALTYISHQWEEYYGNPIAESLGLGWVKYIHPADVADAEQRWAHSLSTGTLYETEFRVKHHSGSYRWNLVRALAAHNDAGEIISWNGSNTDIHDKRLSDEAVRESDTRFKVMADNIPNLAWMANADGWIYWYNKTWYDYTGTTPEQMEGWGWQSVHHPEELPKVLLEWQASIQSGQPFEMVFPLKGGDGRFRQFLTRVLPVHNDDGKIYQWFGTNTDITAQIEIEQSLKESEARFRTMAEGTDVYIGVGDASGNAIYFNKAWTELTGRTTEELIKHGWLDLVHPDDRESYVKLYSDAFEKREAFTGEFRLLNKNGRYRWLLAQAPPRFHPGGSFAGYISSCIDITDRKNAEKALIEKEQNLRNTILQAPVAMCIFRGPNHVVELANERMFELWGKTAVQVMHKPIFEGLPESKNQGFEELLHKVYSSGESVSAQGVPVTLPRNGTIEVAYVNFVYEAYKEADGSVSGILAVAVDVTAQVIARQKIEEVVAARTRELADANSKLQKSNAELGQFAYIASHDLQEPLRKITTFSQLLENSLGDDVSQQSQLYLQKIHIAASRMITLIRDVLTYSELVKDDEVFAEVDLHQIIENIQMDYELLIEQKEAVIHCKDLPVIEAIPLQMSQLFGNLVGNALKFARTDRKPVITIAATSLTQEDIALALLNPKIDYYKIRFADNGIGLKKEYTEQIFAIFQRLHRKTEYEGTGIGLALCKKIVINHGGTIDANESSDEGAVFTVILPAKQQGRGGKPAG